MSTLVAARLTRAEFEVRMRRIEALLEREQLDALIGYSVGNQAGPVAYLAGYEPRFGQRDVAAFVLVPGQRYALVLYAYWDLPELHTWTEDVQLTRDLGATPLLMEVARVKSDAEVALVRDATRQTDAGVRAFLDGLTSGTDERDLAAAVQAAIVKAGADRLAFPVLVFSRELSEMGIGFPRPRALEAGDQVNLVCGAQFGGYNTDVGRVGFAGGLVPPETRELLETADAMHASLLHAARPGRLVAQLAQAGLDVVHDRGHAAWRYRFGAAGYAGHGIGCWLDEPPRLQLDVADHLEANMVVVLEVRLGREGGGGVTITDPVVITEVGADRLSSVPIRTWDYR